jgi:hypothetical protein
MRIQTKNLEQGQALVTLLFFMVIGGTIITSAALVIANSMLSGSTAEQSTSAYYAAESGVEDGLLRLLRNPSFTGPFTLTVGDGSVLTTVTGSGTNKTINAVGTSGTTVRKIQVQATTTNGQQSISSWQEVIN